MSIINDPSDLYRELQQSGRLASARRLTYRCATDRRCLLLDAIDTPLGVLLHQKRYKYSEAENLRRSTASGRAKNAENGGNKWFAKTYFIDQSALAYPQDREAQQGVSCDHVLDFHLTAKAFHADWDQGCIEVRVRGDGSRFAVS